MVRKKREVTSVTGSQKKKKHICNRTQNYSAVDFSPLRFESVHKHFCTFLFVENDDGFNLFEKTLDLHHVKSVIIWDHPVPPGSD